MSNCNHRTLTERLLDYPLNYNSSISINTTSSLIQNHNPVTLQKSTRKSKELVLTRRKRGWLVRSVQSATTREERPELDFLESGDYVGIVVGGERIEILT
jgi:hypothetical protein